MEDKNIQKALGIHYYYEFQKQIDKANDGADEIRGTDKDKLVIVANDDDMLNTIGFYILADLHLDIKVKAQEFLDIVNS